jgi:TRAP-type C4-dicarboxylate transport system substrate-binding protein
MKKENKIGEITFENFIQLRKVLEEAWNRGKLEQSIKDLKKETDSYNRIAKKLGIEITEKSKVEDTMNFNQWFLEIIKKIQIL